MASIELKLTLPESLAEEARASGLLDPSALADLLRVELRRRREDRLFAAADRLAASAGSPMAAVEIEAEIEAARAERRNGKAGRS